LDRTREGSRQAAPVGPVRIPPHNLEAETAVLGGILIDNEAIDLVQDKLRPEDFYREGNGRIFAAMIELRRREQPTDLITLTDDPAEAAAIACGERVSDT